MEGVCSHKPKSIKAPSSGSIEQSSGEKLDKINAFDFLMCFELRPRAQLVFPGNYTWLCAGKQLLSLEQSLELLKCIPAGGCHPGLSKTSLLCRWKWDQPGRAPDSAPALKLWGWCCLKSKVPSVGEVLLRLVRAEQPGSISWK